METLAVEAFSDADKPHGHITLCALRKRYGWIVGLSKLVLFHECEAALGWIPNLVNNDHAHGVVSDPAQHTNGLLPKIVQNRKIVSRAHTWDGYKT